MNFFPEGVTPISIHKHFWVGVGAFLLHVTCQFEADHCYKVRLSEIWKSGLNK